MVVLSLGTSIPKITEFHSVVHTDVQAEEREVAKDDGPRAGSTGWKCQLSRMNIVGGQSAILVYSSVAVDYPDQKQLGEERVYLGLYVAIHHRAGTEAKVMEEPCFLACFLWLTQLLFIYSPDPTA